MMLAKFDPVETRNSWLRHRLEFVATSDPDTISVTARPHYVQLQTHRLVDAYLVGLAYQVRPTLEKLIAWMETQPEPDRLVFSTKNHDRDAWWLALYEWRQALGLCKWLSGGDQAEQLLTGALEVDWQDMEQARLSHAAAARALRRNDLSVRLATALSANAPQLGLKIYEAAAVKRPTGLAAPALRFGQWACRHLERGGTRDATFVVQGKEMLTKSLLPRFFWEHARIEPALWLKAIYFDSGMVRTPEQTIAMAYDSMPGIERPDFVPNR